MDGQVIALLVQNLERLDESVKEESDGVHNTLGWISLACLVVTAHHKLLFSMKKTPFVTEK